MTESCGVSPVIKQHTLETAFADEMCSSEELTLARGVQLAELAGSLDGLILTRSS